MVELPQQMPQQQMQMMMPGTFMLPSLMDGGTAMLPSLSGAAPMLPSMDPSMTDDVAARYGQQLIQQNATQLQEMMVLSGDYTTQMRDNLKELNSIGSNLAAIDRLLSGAVQGLQGSATSLQTGLGGSAGLGGGGGTRMAPTGLHEGRPAQEEEDTGDGRTFRQRFTEARQVGEDPHSMGQRVSQVTRTMSGRAAEAFQSKIGSWDLTPDADGNINYHDPTGAITRTAPATEDNLARAAREGARATRVTGMLSNYAEGGSILGGVAEGGGALGALGAGALKAAGPIGLAVGVADFGFKQFTSQTEAGTQYRAAYGEDAGRFAFSQRAGADLQGLKGYFTGIGYGRSKENYEAAAQQGLTGDRLGEASNFMNDMYTKLGLDTQTSAQAVQISAQNTTISLKDLSDNIMAVSKAAVEAGKNSEVAVTSFLATTQQIQQNVTDTAAAPALAGTLSTAMSKNLASSLNTPGMASSLAGMLTQPNIAMLAQRQGIPYATLAQEVATGTGNASASVIGNGLQMAVQSICRAAGTTPEAVRAVVAKDYPGQTHLSNDQQQAVMNQIPGFAHVSPAVMIQIFSTFSLTVEPGQVVNFFFNALLTDLANLGADSAAASGLKDPASAQKVGGASGILGDTGYLTSEGMSALGLPMIQAGGSAGRGGGANLAAGRSLTAAMSSGPIKDYTDYASASGNRDVAVEKLIAAGKQVTDFSGSGSLDDVKFLMQDGSGHTLSEILKDKTLLSQFDAGKATVKSKAGTDVESVTKWTGYGASTTAAAAGQSLGGGYTIGLTPYAQQLFNLTGPSDAQSKGVPPVGSVSPIQYPR